MNINFAILQNPFVCGIIALSIVLIIFLCFLMTFIVKNSNKKILIATLYEQLRDFQKRNQQLEEVNSGLSNENSRLKTEYANQRRYMEDKLQYIEQNKNEMALKFRDISNEIIRSQSQLISENQKNALSTLLSPFQEQLKSFKDEVNKANLENIKNKSSFDEQFKNLKYAQSLFEKSWMVIKNSEYPFDFIVTKDGTDGEPGNSECRSDADHQFDSDTAEKRNVYCWKFGEHLQPVVGKP